LAAPLVLAGSVAEGLQLLDQAERQAESIHNTAIGTAVALCGGNISQALWNPRNAQEWCKRELVKPRTALARNDNVPLQLHYTLVSACISAGELTQARASLAEVDAENKPADLLFFEGEWEVAGKRLTAESERSMTAGNRLGELTVAPDLARAQRFTGERTQAAQVLQRPLEISVAGGNIEFELFARSLLATIAADAGDASEALPHLQRCRQIVARGETWFGLAGGVERAEAVVAAAQGDSVAEEQFKKAIATFQQYCLPWEEADTLQYWGRALFAAGERTRAVEKFDAAIEIYRSHEASQRFIEYVMADKERAQGSNSTHPV